MHAVVDVGVESRWKAIAMLERQGDVVTGSENVSTAASPAKWPCSLLLNWLTIEALSVVELLL